MICPNCNSHPKGNICVCGRILYEAKVKPVKTLQRSKTPIKKVSKRRGPINREYNALVKYFLSLPENERCPIFPELRTDQCHHVRGRGKYLLDTTTWLAVSDKGHKWIHANVKESHEKGWLELKLMRYD